MVSSSHHTSKIELEHTMYPDDNTPSERPLFPRLDRNPPALPVTTAAQGEEHKKPFPVDPPPAKSTAKVGEEDKKLPVPPPRINPPMTSKSLGEEGGKPRP